jgi:DNA-directed RNA polymerase subunit RPC12/RpoP
MTPKCTKCGRGPLIPEKILIGDREKTVSVACASCGERIFRDHLRRKPTRVEMNTRQLPKEPKPLRVG